jgi:predicted NAD/FAD-binding protein
MSTIPPGQRVAVVGTGISGMVAAYLLHPEHRVTVFEADDRIGGHTHTVPVGDGASRTWVDTGFIVFNDWTYPNFVRLLDRLGVASQPSNMSFSVSCRRSGFEYNGGSLRQLLARKRNALSPRFWLMLRDILRFYREAPALLETDEGELPLGEYLRRGGYSRAFVDWHIVPMGAAIWSTSADRMLGFPARFFVRFFQNHGFLSVNDRPAWRTIQHGSRSYAAALTAPYRDRIRLASPVVRIVRHRDGVDVKAAGAEPERFDHVVVAAHSDQALAMLADPSDAEREILGAIDYQPNRTLLHTDASVMPRRRAAWASWNYHVPRDPRQEVSVTYWMNSLQSLPDPTPYLVTLNPVQPIDPDKILQEMVYDHPLFTPRAVAAQRRHGEISGVRRTHYCGAYWRYGFHEDGVVSALEAVRPFGKDQELAA